MKPLFECTYCGSRFESAFSCPDCEVCKCEECVSRREESDMRCVECWQNSPLLNDKFFLTLVMSEADSTRVRYVQSGSMRSVMRQIEDILKGEQKSKKEIVIRVRSTAG